MKPFNRGWLTFGLGAVVLLVPLLGFPRTFDMIVLVLAGLFIMALSLRNVRAEYLKEDHADSGQN